MSAASSTAALLYALLPVLSSRVSCDYTQGLQLTEQDIQKQLSRRRPGQSNLTTPVRLSHRCPHCRAELGGYRTKQRDEADAVSIQSGLEYNVTLGTPIGLRVQNKDQRPHDYSETDLYPRPSHADYTYLLKYGVKASSGGGRSSARETIGPSFQPTSLIRLFLR